MTSDRVEHERRLAELLAGEPGFNAWLESMRAFAVDGSGKTIILGLTPAETLEFVELNPVYYDNRESGRRDDPRNRRYLELRERHDLARMKDVAENLSHWNGESGKPN